MISRSIFIIFFIFLLNSCSKNQVLYEPSKKIDAYEVYKEGLEAFEKNNFFFANKKFSEAEKNFEIVEMAAKSAIMSSFCLYAINFYDQAEESLNRFIRTYPSDKNIIYANYLIAIIYFEQMSDEKKDLEPLIKARKKIDEFTLQYPNSDYAIDLKFKRDLINNQIAAKELFVAKYYISIQKWVPAINRLKNILNNYDTTVFVEESLHRLVEIHYHLGLENEAKKYAKILGYNYNSSEWFEQSYKILNKDYDLQTKKNTKKKNSLINNLFKKIN